MTFTSFSFLGFVAGSVFCYYILPRSIRWVALLLASCAFYGTGGLVSCGWLTGVIVLCYLTGLGLGSLNLKLEICEKEERAPLKKRKKRLITFTLVLLLGLLYGMKYFDFTLSFFTETRLDLVVPLGLSFFLFQSIGYVVDIYRRKYYPQKNIFKYALFTSFFPQMVQGPIGRYDELSQTLLAPNRFSFDHIKAGLQLMLRGYFKKLIIADRAVLVVQSVIVEDTVYGGAVVAFGILLYSIQLYCDFSGGIDIARGVARLFGVVMAENFRAPIFAHTLTEFWRRWHITLGGFLKDYLFYPISLSRGFGKISKWARKHLKGRLGKIFATSLATFLIYFVIGIWHGANFRYIAFGFYNGILITMALLLDQPMAKLKSFCKIPDNCPVWRCVQILRTWIIVFVGRYITCAPRLTTAITLMGITVLDPQFFQLFDGTLLTFSLDATDYGLIFGGMFVLIALEWYGEYRGSVSAFLQRHVVLDMLFVVVPLALLLVFGIFREDYISSSFIYQQY
ncbi:MAG: MBOAT family O-acyltransferase [Eubacteriales bacterium]